MDDPRIERTTTVCMISFAPLGIMMRGVVPGQIDPRQPIKYCVLMALLDDIREKIEARQYEFSKHAVDHTIIRDIRVAELEQAISNQSEVIEDYPNDKYGPSCLILGFTSDGRPLHIQCGYPTRPLVKVITVYEPDPALWIDLRVRRIE